MALSREDILSARDMRREILPGPCVVVAERTFSALCQMALELLDRREQDDILRKAPAKTREGEED